LTPISSPAAKSAAGIGSTEMLQIFISNSEGHALTGSSAKWRKKGVGSLGEPDHSACKQASF
jgi:hypothetical protein